MQQEHFLHIQKLDLDITWDIELLCLLPLRKVSVKQQSQNPL